MPLDRGHCLHLRIRTPVDVPMPQECIYWQSKDPRTATGCLSVPLRGPWSHPMAARPICRGAGPGAYMLRRSAVLPRPSQRCKQWAALTGPSSPGRCCCWWVARAAGGGYGWGEGGERGGGGGGPRRGARPARGVQQTKPIVGQRRDRLDF
jgi:hypothetical protein